MKHTCPHCGGEFAEAVLSETAATADKVMNRIVQANEGKVEEQARNVLKAAVVGVGIGPALRPEIFSGDKQIPSSHGSAAVTPDPLCKVKTPRVDALDFGDQTIFPGPGYGDLWELARQLERELAEKIWLLDATVEQLRHDQAELRELKSTPSARGELPAAYIEHHKGGDNLVWDDPGGERTPLYKAQYVEQKS